LHTGRFRPSVHRTFIRVLAGTKPAGRRGRSPGSRTLQTRHAGAAAGACRLAIATVAWTIAMVLADPADVVRTPGTGRWEAARYVSAPGWAIPRTAGELRTVFLRCKRIAG
jgi:hypothetical protein